MSRRNDQFTKETLTKEWLYQKYIVEGLDCPQIGKLIDRDSKTVWHWLKKYKIPTRPRGTNYKENLNHGRPLGWNHTEETKRKVGKASRERGAVPFLRNGIHWLKGAPPADNPNWKGGSTPERQSFYNSREWKEVVKKVWKRDNAICQRCGKDHRNIDRKKEQFHIHHIVSFTVKELRCEISNLILLCNSCHRWVHSSQNKNREFIS